MPFPPDRPEHPTLSSAWLMGAKQMDSDAWSRLVTTFGPIVYRWCRASSVPMSDAADVVQEVFATVARGIGDFERQKDKGSFRSWLATITRRRTADYFRRAAKAQAAAGGTDAMLRLEQHAESLDSTINESNVQAAISQQMLGQVRAEFEPTTWDAFWLTTIEEKPASEVAELTGLSRASVYQAKSRILRRLRQRLER
ncbi:RNA polymerase sigma factor [Novipirellula aureliae]|nr:sigma-70 family RNA polymerase sigma factor [Novipirellula aureliae]